MAKIKIGDVVSHIDANMRKALKETLKKHFPDLEFNDRAVFKTFVKKVGSKCKIRSH